MITPVDTQKIFADCNWGMIDANSFRSLLKNKNASNSIETPTISFQCERGEILFKKGLIGIDHVFKLYYFITTALHGDNRLHRHRSYLNDD